MQDKREESEHVAQQLKAAAASVTQVLTCLWICHTLEIRVVGGQVLQTC